MLILIVALQAILLVGVIALLLRRTGQNEGQNTAIESSFFGLRELLTRMDGRSDAFDAHLRSTLEVLRREFAAEAHVGRQAGAAASMALRTEIGGSIASLGSTLHSGLESFRADNKTSAEALREAVQRSLDGINQRLVSFVADASRSQNEAREALHARLCELSASNTVQQEKLRAGVEDRLQKLNESNAAKLEEMRLTVDEKLQATLNDRLTKSFGQVTTHLGEVQKGLGEMKELATGVGDLKKVLSNVKARGIVGEFQLGQQLEQMFSPEQYIRNASIKANTQETVEYALKFPNGAPDSFVLLPIDAKFPKDDWERLEHAYEHGSAEEIATAGRAFERAIRTEGKRICDKYIDPPVTMPHAIMFLPTESLYAEVVRRPGLLSDVQSNCRVTIAGPSTFMAILTSFQMGFHTLAIQKKGDQVWRVLSKAKTEFTTFGTLMDKVERQVGTVQNTLREINGKTTTINRALKDVSSPDSPAREDNLLGFEEIAGVAPLLAASSEEQVTG
ncbi:MAG: DNA recombination protein RmuC [Acidobacteriaceae bacterium]